MASEAEGFICPYCLVGFASSGKLQSHFVDMHSGEGLVDDYDIVEYGNVDGEESQPFPSVLGHQFKLRRFSRPCTCDVCGEIIWQDGLMCNYCQVTIHVEKCEEKLDKMCSADTSEPLVSSGEAAQQTMSSQPQAPKGILPLVRRQIAKGRDRYISEEFDLDLTYITERIIAMSYPASGVESAYRNNLKDVAKMLKTKHQDNYMIFNLSERSYDISKFNNQVLDFGWPDHLAPSLERLSSVCKSIKSWLDSDPQHVAVVHCKGGKGRTGCVIAAFMHYSEICQSAAAALDRFAMKRFYDNKLGGVTQPSQRKYVHYFSDLLAGKIDLQSPPVVLNHVIIHGIPNFDGKGGCRPFLKIYENMKLAHTSGLYVCSTEKERVKISVYGGLKLQGEVLVKCFHKKIHKGMDSIFRCQFHSAVVYQDLRLVLGRQDLDDAFKDKRFPEGTKVELLFEPWSPQSGGHKSTTPEPADIRTSLLDGKNNGSTDQQLTDFLAKRDSYASFQGGYDSGRPEETANANLIQFDSPDQDRRKIRSMSTDSYNMDPERIERVLHPNSEQVYTVVSKPQKRTPTPDDGIQAELVKQHLYTAPIASKPRPSSAYVAPPSMPIAVPSKPPPPKTVLKKFSPSGRPTRPAPPSKPVRPPLPKMQVVDEPDADYAEIDEDLPPVEEPKKEPKKEPPRGEVGRGGNVRGGDKKVVKGAAKPVISPVHKAGKSPNKSPVHHGKGPNPHGKRNLPSYDEVKPDQHIVVEPLPSRQSALDNDMWARFKFQTLPTHHPESLSRRSSSSSNLTSCSSSDYYSTLADISLGVGPTGELSPQPLRRHSFSEGEEKMIIIGTVNRDSIIPVGTLTAEEPEYKNVAPYGDASYAEPGRVSPKRKGNFVQPTYENTVLNGGVDGGEGAECDQDYMNQDPEGLFHTYTNQDDLMQQMRAENLPVPEPSTNTSDGTDHPPQQAQSSWFTGAALLKLLKPPFAVFGKPRHQEIHSGKILDEDRLSTLAPFELSGPPQVGRDYEAFHRKESAWGEHPQSQKERPESLGKVLKTPAQPTHKSRDPSVEDVEEKEKLAAKMSPVTPRKQKKLPLVPRTNSPQLTSPPEGAPPPPPKPSSPMVSRKPFHPPLAKKPSAPTPAPKPQVHQKLQASNSVDQPLMVKGKARDLAPSDLVVKKRNAPPKPPPPYAHEQKKAPSESTVKSLMPYWYRPNITREEAIDFVRQLESGSFIVRDSQTVSGGYALTIKVSEKQVRQRRKLAEDTPVTEDMCVTHFLIQPDPEGVKLQGWSERAFKSLPEFIAQHTVEKLCLPCKLVLPKSGPSSRRKPATMREALITGAACDLVSLGSVDVPGPGSDSLLAQTVQQMKSLELSNMNIVTFKASKEGITLTDNINGMYIKRQYPISSVTFCGLDPNDTRWDFPHLQHLGETVSLTSKPCFGIFYRPQDNSGFSCLLFAEFDSSQPVTSVVSYVQRIMKQQRH